MAERMISLSIAHLFDGDHNHPGIPHFIEQFSSALYTGDGKAPRILEALNIGAEFPARLLVGIPVKRLTREQRLIAESFCSMIFGHNLGHSKGLWTHGKGWQPVNHGREAAPIADSVLDTEWLLSLGIPKAVWKNNILFAASAFDANTKPLPSTLMRYLFGLVAFGFSDPYQFFTAKRTA